MPLYMEKLSTYTDERGSLTLCTVGREIPFRPERAYWIHHVPANAVRGQHANRVVDEYVICVHGSVTIEVEDASGLSTYELTSPDEGLVIPAMAWSRQYNFSPDAVLLVLASCPYDRSTYLDTYEEWKQAMKGMRAENKLCTPKSKDADE